MSSVLRHLGRAAGAAAIILAAVAAGTGWQYLLRSVGVLDAGPGVTGALPLQRLAGQDTQPLLRVLAAWLPAGLATGFALGSVAGLRRPTRAAVAGLGGFVLVFAAGAVCDAITETDPIGPHLVPQLEHAALWLVPAVLAACALIPRPPGWRAAGASDPNAGARRSAGSAEAAA